MTQKNPHYELLLNGLMATFVNEIPFHEYLGIDVKRTDNDTLMMTLDMKDHLIGNLNSNILHGGVIATLLDAQGGLTAFAEVLKKLEHLPSEEQLRSLAKGATIDLRVDYLRPGKGDTFVANAEILRSGNKVTVTRMSLYNNYEELIAVGSGTYSISL